MQYHFPYAIFDHFTFARLFFQARTIALEAMETLTNFTDVLSSLAVVGDEALVMSVPQMSLVLQKIRPDVEGEHVVGNGQVSVQFVNITEVLGGNVADGNVDVQVLESNAHNTCRKLFLSFSKQQNSETNKGAKLNRIMSYQGFIKEVIVHEANFCVYY